eukprot:gene15000-21065_t
MATPLSPEPNAAPMAHPSMHRDLQLRPQWHTPQPTLTAIGLPTWPHPRHRDQLIACPHPTYPSAGPAMLPPWPPSERDQQLRPPNGHTSALVTTQFGSALPIGTPPSHVTSNLLPPLAHPSQHRDQHCGPPNGNPQHPADQKSRHYAPPLSTVTATTGTSIAAPHGNPIGTLNSHAAPLAYPSAVVQHAAPQAHPSAPGKQVMPPMAHPSASDQQLIAPHVNP